MCGCGGGGLLHRDSVVVLNLVEESLALVGREGVDLTQHLALFIYSD